MLISCKTNNPVGDNIIHIREASFIQIELDELLNSSDIIPLEQRDESLLNKVVKVLNNSDGIFVWSSGKIYQFNVNQSYIRRLIGHNISIVEDSFVCSQPH